MDKALDAALKSEQLEYSRDYSTGTGNILLHFSSSKSFDQSAEHVNLKAFSFFCYAKAVKVQPNKGVPRGRGCMKPTD
jgi:hypothetical protein